MQIQLNTDHTITGTQRLTARVEAQVQDALGRYADRVTRVEVHLQDNNSDKGGAADKRCLMEARVRNHQPVSVSHEAGEYGLAVDGAANKLARALDRLFGKMVAQRRDGQRQAKESDTMLADEAPLAADSPLTPEPTGAKGTPAPGTEGDKASRTQR